jgi:hypothetical protein
VGTKSVTDAVAKHLEFVQAIIHRLAGNSFLLKGWSITLAVGLFALAASRDSAHNFAVVALLPSLSFWGLDAYYLRQERLFCALYRDIVERANGTHTPVEMFAIDTAIYNGRVHCWVRTLFSPTVFWVHAAVVTGVVGAAVLI